MFAWVFFRADSFERALTIVKGMCGLNGIVVPFRIALILEKIGINATPVAEMGRRFHLDSFIWTPITFILLSIFVVALKNSQEWIQRRIQRPALWSSFAVSAVFVAAVGYLTRISEFLYFQF